MLIGHSMGAIIVQRALRRAKARAMALLAPVPPQGLLGSSFMLAASNPEIFNEINKIQIFDGLAGSPDLLRQAIFSQRLPPAEVKRYLRRMRHESQRALFDLSWPQHFWIERTSIPVHIIGAADDLFFPPSLVEAAGCHDVPKLIAAPTVVPAAGTRPKRIEEFVGRVNSGTAAVSIARMVSPPGWVEPGQKPQFDEYTLVLEGALRVESASGTLEVAAGQAVHAAAGE